jgi:hypothetical protein
MGRFVIAVFKPRPGQSAALAHAVAKHTPLLRQLKLLSERPASIMRATDGTVVEVFEWLSTEAIEAAHRHPAVQALWAEFAAASEYVPLSALPEAAGLFAEFEAYQP